MNASEKRCLYGTVGIRLEEKGELKRPDEMEAIANRLANVEKKGRLLIKHTGVYPEAEPVMSTGVSFHASLHKDCIFRKEEPLFFDEVIDNAGGGFNSSEFVAPLPGKYLFNLTLRAQFKKEVSVSIICNEEMVGRVTSGHGDIDVAPSSMTVAVELNKHDVVQVVHSSEKTGYYHGNGYTTFAGFLFD